MILNEDKVFLLTCLTFLPFHVFLPSTTCFITVLISSFLLFSRKMPKQSVIFISVTIIAYLLLFYFCSNIILRMIIHSISVLLLIQQLFPSYHIYKVFELTFVIFAMRYCIPEKSILTFSIIGISALLRYDKNLRKSVKCYTSYLLLAITALVYGFILLPIAILRPWNIANIRLVALVARPLSQILGIDWEIRNNENMISDEHSAVIVSNHQSALDVLGMLYLMNLLKFRCTAVGRKLIFWIWPFGLTLWLCGVVFISRKPHFQKTYQQMNEAANLIEHQKAKLWIFPEGTRNKHPHTLLPFKKGAFRVAIKNQVPIIPIVFSPYYFVNWKEKTFGNGKIILEILPPIFTKGYSFSNLDDLTNKTYSEMTTAYAKLDQECAVYATY